MPKSVYGNLYVHRDFVRTLQAEAQRMVAEAIPLIPKDRPWNLVRLDLENLDLSFSFYPDFEENPHPQLKSWAKVDLKTGSVKCGSYAGENPFILHRKETFVDKTHPFYQKFKNLSVQEQEAGLYEQPHNNLIGRKNYWENLLYQKGLVIVNHQLQKGNPEPPGAPQLGLFSEKEAPIGANESLAMSGKTAMHRSEPSLPATILVQRKLVSGKLFDWGCGHGADLEFFRKSGIDAEGWDPNHKPEKPPKSYPAGSFTWVYCGYVLNTLADPADRIKVLREIHDFLPPGRNLAISVRSAREIEGVRKITWRRYGDGWLTTKNTFQREFTAEELVDLLETTGLKNPEVILTEECVFIIAKRN